MALVLAIEPDSRQAAILKRVIHESVHAELVVVDSRDAAIAALSARVPDVILMTALLSPRDGDEMIAHLRTLAGADHVQTHTIPQLASSRSEPDAPSSSGGLLSKFRSKKKAAGPIAGCDPMAFAREVTTFLERAEEMKARTSPMMSSSMSSTPVRKPVSAKAVSEFVVDMPPAPGAPDSEPDAPKAWADPFAWRPAEAAPTSKAAESPAASSNPVFEPGVLEPGVLGRASPAVGTPAARDEVADRRHR